MHHHPSLLIHIVIIIFIIAPFYPLSYYMSFTLFVVGKNEIAEFFHCRIIWFSFQNYIVAQVLFFPKAKAYGYFLSLTNSKN